MANITVLFAGFNSDIFFSSFSEKTTVSEKPTAFSGKTAAEFSLKWALKNGERVFIFSLDENKALLSNFIDSDFSSEKDRIEILSQSSNWTVSQLAFQISECCKNAQSETAVYSWIDLPFLNDSVTSSLISMHTEYLAEYSFADGYPYGLSPEIINSGTASIIAELTKDKELFVNRTSLFDAMKADINSFEIETLVAETDYRQLRISLETSTKGGLKSSSELYESLLGEGKSAGEISKISISEIAERAAKNPAVLRNIPHFFDIQITSKINHKTIYSPEIAGIGIESLPDMEVEKFRILAKKISEFNPDAVVSLSAFGEPLLHKDFLQFVKIASEKNLRVLIETDGLQVSEKMAEEISRMMPDGKIDWIVKLDAADSSFYSKIHQVSESASETAFNSALSAVSVLSEKFPNHVYPQLTRVYENEENLEKFFRFWKKPDSASSGKLIIKKYDSLCGKLPDRKPADLSPLSRKPCWHLARDFVVLSDGSVPKCRSCGKAELRGNAFSEELTELWEKGTEDFSNQLNQLNLMNQNCGGCDEYYTFNF